MIFRINYINITLNFSQIKLLSKWTGISIIIFKLYGNFSFVLKRLKLYEEMSFKSNSIL